MRDCYNHSLGIWRSFYLYDTVYASDLIGFFRDKNLSFSLQRYWAKLGERNHVSFRVCFKDIDELEKTQKELKKVFKDLEIAERSYDTEYWVKKAYEVGTKAYLGTIDACVALKQHPTAEFATFVMHAYLNNLEYNYLDEAKLHGYVMNRVLNEIK